MLSLNFTPFPELQTERLLLREISMDDAEDFFMIRKDPKVMRYLDRSMPDSVEEIKNLIQVILEGCALNSSIAWVITLKGKNQFIGLIGYHKIDNENYRAEIGYQLNSMYWNKGIMSEAIQTIIDFGFNKMSLHSIEANINPANERSKLILLKNNFEKEAYFRENYFFRGKFIDSEIYSLIKPA